MAYSAPTTADKRAARLARNRLANLVTAMASRSGRETLKLNDVQRQGRRNLEQGTTVSLSVTSSGLHKGMALSGLCVEHHGELRPDECRAVQPAAVEPEYGLQWCDLTPPQRRQLRKYRAGKRRERELAMTHRQMKREGEIAEAKRHLQSALNAADATSIQYWQQRLDTLTRQPKGPRP